MCDGITLQTIDIVEEWKLFSLLKYFVNYSFNVKSRIKYIVIDIWSLIIFNLHRSLLFFKKNYILYIKSNTNNYNNFIKVILKSFLL